MWADKAGLLRKMWADQPFMQRTQERLTCFVVRRDDTNGRQRAEQFFDETERGLHCNSNWYEGNHGELGDAWHRPRFQRDAPALLGFDETIDQYCMNKMDYRTNTYPSAWAHARNCVSANVNILSLYGNRVPYNSCRNLEWQTCAALGKLPGQGAQGSIIFSKAPITLDPRSTSDKPFGQCRGWRSPEANALGCATGFATDDIFFLEVCTYHKLCANRDELWTLHAGEPWQCELSPAGFRELKELLLPQPDFRPPQGEALKCREYCNEWTCNSEDCLGCKKAGRDIKCKSG